MKIKRTINRVKHNISMYGFKWYYWHIIWTVTTKLFDIVVASRQNLLHSRNRIIEPIVAKSFSWTHGMLNLMDAAVDGKWSRK